MLTPIHNPRMGKLRVIGYVSGSGDTLWRAYEMQKEMEGTPLGCPFEVVGVFSSKKESKAAVTAQSLGVPYFSIDIQDYYEQRGKPIKDKELRKEYDAEALALFEYLKADAIILAGYVWATTDCLLDRYLIINVHPGDLSIIKDGKRTYAGANGVGSALDAHEPFICSSSHLATKKIDGGPLLLLSEKIAVDYKLHSSNEERVKHYLKLVNEQGRMTGTRTLLEVGLGNFQTDNEGNVYFKGKPAPIGIRIESWEENRPFYQRKTEKLLYPDSVAVFGASQKPGIGRTIVENILKGGYSGKVYAINVRGEDVLAAKGYKSVSDIEGGLDLAVIATPGNTVLEIAEACGQKEVHTMICISAGFKELGGEGIVAQEKLIDIVNKYNMRLVGPNCMGLMNANMKLNATILHGDIARGNAALVTQSGAIGAAMLDYAQELGIGFSFIVSLGNQADVTVCDLLPFLGKDENTRVIVMYLETILEPERFWQLAAQIQKPILLLKAGRTSAGMAAASSHTGSLAGNDEIVNALIKKAGIVRVYSLEELFLCASALSNMPQVQVNRIGHLTNAGGPSILITDALSNSGFTLPVPSDKLKSYLRENLLREASVQNPVDIVAPAPPEHYVLAAKAMIESGEYDALPICCITPAVVDPAKVAEALIPVLKEAKIPVVTAFPGSTLAKNARDILAKNNIPATQYPEHVATMLTGMRKRPKFANNERSGVTGAVLNQGNELLRTQASGEYLSTPDAHALLKLFGIEVARHAILKSPEDSGASEFSFPVVAKIEHPEIIHKSDVGGVRLNIASADELKEVTADFLKRFTGAHGVFVQEQVPVSLELIVGSVSDPQFGSSVMVGLGGVWVEVMKDVVFGYPPVGREEAMNMIDGLRCKPLLTGYRGKVKVNCEALADLLQKVSALVLALPGIVEIDLNPVVYHPQRNIFMPLDVRIKKG